MADQYLRHDDMHCRINYEMYGVNAAKLGNAAQMRRDTKRLGGTSYK